MKIGDNYSSKEYNEVKMRLMEGLLFRAVDTVTQEPILFVFDANKVSFNDIDKFTRYLDMMYTKTYGRKYYTTVWAMDTSKVMRGIVIVYNSNKIRIV